MKEFLQLVVTRESLVHITADLQQPPMAGVEELKTESKQDKPVPAGSRPQVPSLVIPKSPPPPMTPDAQLPLPYDPPKTFEPTSGDPADCPVRFNTSSLRPQHTVRSGFRRRVPHSSLH